MSNNAGLPVGEEFFLVPVFSPQQLLDGTTVVYLPHGLVRLSDPKSLEILRRLHPVSGRVLSKPELQQLTELEEEDFSSLVSSGFARRIPNLAKRIDSIAIVTDDAETISPLSTWLREYGSVTLEVLDSKQLEAASAQAEFVLLFANQYIKSLPRQVYKHFAESTVFLTTYRLDRFLYIDSLYLPCCNTPDHYHNIETVRRKSADSFEQTGNLFNLMDRALGDKNDLSYAIELNAIERMRVTHILYLHVKRILGTSLTTINADEVCDSFSYDLIVDRMSRGRARFYDTLST